MRRNIDRQTATRRHVKLSKTKTILKKGSDKIYLTEEEEEEPEKKDKKGEEKKGEEEEEEEE